MAEKGAIGRPPQYNETIQKMGKNYLFAVGINDYVHCPKLKNAVKDVQDFIQLLTTKYQFETDNITTLLDAEANSRNIQRAFRQLAEKVNAEDNLIIYFSGHGEFDRVFQQGYWIPVDAERGAFDTYLPNSTIRDVLNAIPSHHTFLIADSCFSGTLFSGRDANRDISQRLERDASRWGLTAGRNEIVDDGKPGTNSPFATKLLDLLEKNDKALGVAELCAKMMEIVSANADQTPRGEPLKVRGHEGGQFYFHLKNDEKAHSALWERTKRTNTADAYFQFWQKNTDSPYRKEARERLEAAEDRETWAKTPHTRTGMLAYLDKFPNGQYIEEANAFLNPKPKIEVKPPKPIEIKLEPKTNIKKDPKPKAEETPKIATKPVETDTDNWKINKINVAVGAIIIGLFIGLWILNAYVIQPLWTSGKEKIQNVILDNQKGVALPPSVKTSQSGFTDPFEGQMVAVKGGFFQSDDMFIDDKPTTYKINDFLISKNEVTQKDWKSIMGEDIPKQANFCDNCPVVAPSNKIILFLTKLNEKTGKKYWQPSTEEVKYIKQKNAMTISNAKDVFRVVLTQ